MQSEVCDLGWGVQDHLPTPCSGTQLFFFSPSANLSDLYFTNRQDRYVLVQDAPEIADFFTELVDAIGDVSLQLQQDDTVQMMEGMVHPYQGRESCLTCLDGVIQGRGVAARV